MHRPRTFLWPLGLRKTHHQVADMRTLRLGRTFDAIMCMGSTLMYALTTEDVAKVLNTFPFLCGSVA